MGKIAALQMTSGPDRDANLDAAKALIESAVSDHVDLVVLPENFAVFSGDEQAKVRLREPFGQGPIQDFLAGQARQHGIYVVGGTIPLVAEDPTKVRAACLLYGRGGDLLARYDKMHLFDVDASGQGEAYRESDSIEPGDQIVTAKTDIGHLGLAVCYDVRFPELFRHLVAQGAEILILPSAFTATTGELHWQTLLQARAVENLCYMVAPNQGTRPDSKRQTWGHSMVVDPWGEILAEADRNGPGVAMADIDHEKQAKLRRRFPALDHRTL